MILLGTFFFQEESSWEEKPKINSELGERDRTNLQIPNSHRRDSNPITGLG